MNDEDDTLAAGLKSIDWSTELPADHSTAVLNGTRRRLRRRRAGIGASVAAAVVLVSVSVAASSSGPRRDAGVDAAGPETSSPAAGCAGMTVAAAETSGNDLVLTLRNGGTSDCDVRGLGIAIKDRPRDQATADDVPAGDPLGAGPLAPDGTVVVTAATDTCQAAGRPLQVSFGDATTLELAFPGDPGECFEPAFGIEITAVSSVGSDAAEPPELTVTVSSSDDLDEQEMSSGSAGWDAASRTLTYLSHTARNGCLPDGRAAFEHTQMMLPSLWLTLLPPDPALRCTGVPAGVVVTIAGLVGSPKELAVVEEGGTRIVPVVLTADGGPLPSVGSLCPGGVATGQQVFVDRGSPPPGVSLEDALGRYPGATVGPRGSREALATVSAEGQPRQVIALNRWPNGSWAVSSTVIC